MCRTYGQSHINVQQTFIGVLFLACFHYEVMNRSQTPMCIHCCFYVVPLVVYTVTCQYAFYKRTILKQSIDLVETRADDLIHIADAYTIKKQINIHSLLEKTKAYAHSLNPMWKHFCNFEHKPQTMFTTTCVPQNLNNVFLDPNTSA